MAQVMLTTIDNPYNPFTHFDEWYQFDLDAARRENRPDCCSYLARIFAESDDIGDNEWNEIDEAVIDDIVELNLTGKFMKVTKDEPEKANSD